jgi:hypothetical protein
LVGRRLNPGTTATAHPAEAALLVETGLFALGAEEPAVPQFSENARALHGGLEPLEQALRILTFTKVYNCQMPLLWVVILCIHDTSSNATWTATMHSGKGQ